MRLGWCIVVDVGKVGADLLHGCAAHGLEVVVVRYSGLGRICANIFVALEAGGAAAHGNESELVEECKVVPRLRLVFGNLYPIMTPFLNDGVLLSYCLLLDTTR